MSFQTGERVLINHPDGALCCEDGLAANGTPARVMKIRDGLVSVRFWEGGPHFAVAASYLRKESLEELVKVSITRFEALTPEQQAEHRRAQKKLWVVGEFMFSHPEKTRAEAEAIYDVVSENDCQGERPMVNTEHKRAVLRHQISELARKVMGTGMLVSCAPGGGQATTDFHPLPRFRVGDHVEKVGGDYSFRGRVVCLFVKLDQRSMRYVVENDDGVLHVYSDKNLKIDVPDFPG